MFGEPAPLKTDPQHRNRNRYCHYHKDHGHDTSDCYELKDKIEELIQKGELRQYVCEPEAGTSSKERQIDKGKAKLGNGVNMIFGGLEGGSSNKARKTLTRRAGNPPLQATLIMQCCDVPPEEHYPMVFTEEEARTVHHPHNDSLAVTILVANKKMDRVLVDSGSSADIMTLGAFDEIGLNRGDMRCVETWLSGFVGGCVAPMGVIDLPVTLGEGEEAVNKNDGVFGGRHLERIQCDPREALALQV